MSKLKLREETWVSPALLLPFHSHIVDLLFYVSLLLFPTWSWHLLPPGMTGSRPCAHQRFGKHVICEWVRSLSPATSQTQDPRENTSFTLSSFLLLQTIGTLGCFLLLWSNANGGANEASGHQKERERKSNSLINPQITVTEKKRSYFL